MLARDNKFGSPLPMPADRRELNQLRTRCNDGPVKCLYSVQIFLAYCMLFSVSAVLLAADLDFLEGRYYEQAVRRGDLPPVRVRLPLAPAVARFDQQKTLPGKPGGRMRLLMGKEKDIRMLTVYGYARLVGFTPELKIQPDILLDLEETDQREFILKLRPGHKWSDGHPFTSADFKYYWHNVANNEELSPHGPPQQLLVDGEAPEVEFPDSTTVIYRWSKPNPYFLPALAAASPLYIYAPQHYLKQFHGDFADPNTLAKLVKESGKRNWAGYYFKHNKSYKQTNPALPSLQPWLNTVKPPSERFLFIRNPFYHRVDSNGVQLPYIDEVVVNIASSSLVPAKTGAGESDLQARNLRLDNVPFLKQGEQRNNYSVRLWSQATGSHIALYPNFNSVDKSWRELSRDKRFRRAMSLLIDREEINQVVYFGLVSGGANTVLPISGLYKESYGNAWTNYDPDRANAILDEIGLQRRDKRGIRLMKDGRPLEVIIHTAGESTEETDVLELIHDSWLKAGIKLYSRPSQREVFRDRVYSGQAMMSVWTGIPNGLPTADLAPDDFVPSSQEQLQWPKWGQFVETLGGTGEAPDLAEAKELVELNNAWQRAESHTQRRTIWQKILDVHADAVLSLGTVRMVPQPVVVSNELNNVPEEGIYNWNPGAFFGLYRPDTFWFNDVRRR